MYHHIIILICAMTLFDIICILIVLGGALYGWRRGVMSQAGSVVGIVVAIILCRVFSGIVAAKFSSPEDSANTVLLHTVMSYAIIFIVVMVAARFLAGTIRTLFDSLSLGRVDNIAGAVFAILKYTLIFSVLLNIWMAIFPSGELKSSYNDTLPSTVINMAPAVLGSKTAADVFDGINAATDSLRARTAAQTDSTAQQ